MIITIGMHLIIWVVTIEHGIEHASSPNTVQQFVGSRMLDGAWTRLKFEQGLSLVKHNLL